MSTQYEILLPDGNTCCRTDSREQADGFLKPGDILMEREVSAWHVADTAKLSAANALVPDERTKNG